MCGRFARKNPTRIIEEFPVPTFPEFGPLYNVAPTQEVPIVRAGESGLEAVEARWGLVPSWANDLSISYKLINARSETAATKPSFRTAFKSRRCLIPADGFYEWKKLAKGKQPYHIHAPDDSPFAFAGLWEHWEREG